MANSSQSKPSISLKGRQVIEEKPEIETRYGMGWKDGFVRNNCMGIMRLEELQRLESTGVIRAIVEGNEKHWVLTIGDFVDNEGRIRECPSDATRRYFNNRWQDKYKDNELMNSIIAEFT